jgi:hypothetical protein
MSNTTDVAVPQPPTQETLDLDGLMRRGSVTQANLQEVLEGSDFIVGRSLVKDKDQLLGVPLVITSIIFRNVKEATKGEKATPARDFASVEYTTVSNDPNQCVEGVFNDGSTGIRRQLVVYLQSKGAIRNDVDPDAAISVKQSVEGQPSGDVPFVLVPRSALPPLVAPRGLRKSEYLSEANGGEPATTYYLA